MKTLYNRVINRLKQLGKKQTKPLTTSATEDILSASDILESYRIETKTIKIENQPFRLSGLLHILTNKISNPLKEQRHRLYYDVDCEVGRYIVGDNDYIEQVLQPIMQYLVMLNSQSEVVLHISKEKERAIVFDAYNPHATVLLEFKSSKRTGTHFIFSIPYIADKNTKSNQEKLKRELKNKRALFIGKDPYDTKRVQYIFNIFGLKIEHMELDIFEQKKPDLSKYDMAILRSADLMPKHIGFFKNFRQRQKEHFKLIITHELFESEQRIEMTKPIADAELYNPVIVGDVEEILNQMFILKSKAVKGISNMEVFDPSSFIVSGKRTPSKQDMEYFRGAHIAVAEDSKVDQRVMRNILDVDGIRIFMVDNGKAMIDLLKTEEIDIIFTDINLLDMKSKRCSLRG